MQGKAKVSLTFGLYEGGQLVRRETVTQDIVKVGKDPKSHLRVDDELASRMHAVIEVASPDDITLIDLGNEPGTIVNGARVNKCKIQPGDQIQIGSTLIMLERADVAVMSAPPPHAGARRWAWARQRRLSSAPPAAGGALRRSAPAPRPKLTRRKQQTPSGLAVAAWPTPTRTLSRKTRTPSPTMRLPERTPTRSSRAARTSIPTRSSLAT